MSLLPLRSPRWSTEHLPNLEKWIYGADRGRRKGPSTGEDSAHRVHRIHRRPLASPARSRLLSGSVPGPASGSARTAGRGHDRGGRRRPAQTRNAAGGHAGDHHRLLPGPFHGLRGETTPTRIERPRKRFPPQRETRASSVSSTWAAWVAASPCRGIFEAARRWDEFSAIQVFRPSNSGPPSSSDRGACPSR